MVRPWPNPGAERYRVAHPVLGPGEGPFGYFEVPTRHAGKSALLRVISSAAEPDLAPALWEHVSVSLVRRTPTWEEMCLVKDLFWEPEEQVVQYHPPRSRYVNCHPFTLHLWRPLFQAVPSPPTWMIA